MSMNTIVASGTGATTGTIDLGTNIHTKLIKIKATGAAVVVLNGKSVSLAVDTAYTDFPIDVTEFSITSGTVDWVAIA